ncbi:hypothetical protein, partial [Thermomonas sp.]|uniref:hypothetical protein n=1 Tax=Thermomonas sp. TaxID=1971895 RepID=UPI00260F8353
MALWSIPSAPFMGLGAEVAGAGTGFFLAFLTGVFVAGFAVLLGAAGVVMPDMLPCYNPGKEQKYVDEVPHAGGALSAKTPQRKAHHTA